jgi:hypothetical protein
MPTSKEWRAIDIIANRFAPRLIHLPARSYSRDTVGFASAIRLRYVVSHDIVLKYGRRLEDAITLARQRVLVGSVLHSIRTHMLSLLIPCLHFNSLMAFVVGGC